MTAAEARWRAQRTQQLLNQGVERFEAIAKVREEAKAQPWTLLNKYLQTHDWRALEILFGEIMETNQPMALRLVEQYDNCPPLADCYVWKNAVCAELRRLHAENEALSNNLQTFEALGGAVDDLQLLRMGYAAARMEIESLQARVQELGQQARECSDRKVVQLESALARHVRSGKDWAMRVEVLERTITTLRAQIASRSAQAATAEKAMRELESANSIALQLDARIKELEAQLDAVGAGGVEPLRKRECLHQIQEPDHFRGATKMARAVLTNAFLADVMTAAGLVSHGKQCKALGKRMAAEAMRLRTAEPQLSLQPLPDWKIDAIRIEEALDQWEMKDAALRYMAREIERAHGITGDEA